MLFFSVISLGIYLSNYISVCQTQEKWNLVDGVLH